MINMASSVVHVVFNMSAAGALRHALHLVGRNERVIGLPDNLSVGPINPPESRRRAAWVEQVLNCDDDDISAISDLFWAEATAPLTTPIVWVCRNNAAEYCGFLEFVRRIGQATFKMVDASAIGARQWIKPDGLSRIVSLGAINPDQIVAAGLFDRPTRLSDFQIQAYRREWAQLANENAPFRIVAEGGLISAPLTQFDADIVACAKQDWRPAAKVVGEAMARLWEMPIPQSPGDLVLWARARALVAAGSLDLDGSGIDLRGSRLRLRESGA
ncbi:MAG: DUF1835 domain-containing protein [Rhodoblastus sp.]|nr:DUF1835 domain-containing protein [Rhodoblastus sp.]